MTDITKEEQKANRKLWVEALRSGKFKQATNTLEAVNGGMCCLGVLAKIAGCERTTGPDVDGNPVIKYDGEAGIAPDAARLWVGLGSDVGELLGSFAVETDGRRVYHSSLTELNDAGMTFEGIADVIESEPEGLFING